MKFFDIVFKISSIVLLLAFTGHVPEGEAATEEAGTIYLEFSGMTPHVGNLLEVRVIETESGVEVTRKSLEAIVNESFTLILDVPETGKNYWIDFYADLNNNKKYDGTPTDHAWRLPAENVTAKTTVPFTHNVNFTDIDWTYLATVNFTGFSPHVGQLLELRILEDGTGTEVNRTTVDPIESANFSLSLPGLDIGNTYVIDLYADLNGNGIYDAPPADHAWRLTSEAITGDTEFDIAHNVNFTDIQWPGVPVAVGETQPGEFSLHGNFPNPFNSSTLIEYALSAESPVTLSIYNTMGQKVRDLVDEPKVPGFYQALWDGRDNNGNTLSSGVYFAHLRNNENTSTMRMMFLK